MTDGNELLCIDFDKTLTNPEGGEWNPAHKQEPDENIVKAVTEAYHDGKKIIIWTARKWNEAPKVAGWLTIHEIPFHGLRCGKGGADRYVDDKTETPAEFVGDETVMRVETPD